MSLNLTQDHSQQLLVSSLFIQNDETMWVINGMTGWVKLSPLCGCESSDVTKMMSTRD